MEEDDLLKVRIREVFAGSSATEPLKDLIVISLADLAS